MNAWIGVGRLTRDPDLKFIAGSGKAVCTFCIAVDRPFSKEKIADFINITVWGKPAENAANYLAKGRQVAVKGYLQTRSYDDKNTGVKRYVTEIVADTVEFIGGAGERKERTPQDSGAGEFEDFSADGFQAIDNDDGFPF